MPAQSWRTQKMATTGGIGNVRGGQNYRLPYGLRSSPPISICLFTNIGSIRRRNLVALCLSPKQLAQSCGGQPKSWANVLSSTNKPFGEKKARHIEACLNLKPGQLDQAATGVELTTLDKVQKRVQRARSMKLVRNSAHAVMTARQFEAIANLLGSHEPIRTAASMVLVDGWRIIEAAMAVNSNSKVLGQAVRRMQTAHTLLTKAYKGEQSDP
jgi:hypothetical protein